MDILGKARKLESRISRTLDLAVEGFVGRPPRQPVEIMQAVLDCAAQQVQPAGRGRRVFPFNHLMVYVLTRTRSDKARFAAVADGSSGLRQRVIERLRSTGCEVDRLDVEITYVPRGKPGWLAPEYHVTFDCVEPQARPEQPKLAPPSAARIDLAVIAGSAERRSYTFTGGRIDIGRRTDVLDHRQHLIRTNHIAFTEGDVEANRSVSRKHAHIVYAPASSEYRVRDDGSARGTAVVRRGQTIPVPQGSRGLRLESGDELVLGEARLRVRIARGEARQG